MNIIQLKYLIETFRMWRDKIIFDLNYWPEII